MDTAERYEQLIAYLSSRLSEPVEQHEHADGSLQFIAGDPPEVVVLLTDTSVIVSEFSAVREAPHTLAVKPRRVGILKWRRLPENELFNALAALVKGAREARTAQFRTCEECGRGTPPERLFSESICQDCADQHHRLVH
ncbi:MAG TPA: hypothetical protein VH497_04430 [Vicinamibacterales bacterium]